MNIQKVIDRLNELNRLEPEATYKLFTSQVKISEGSSLLGDDCKFVCTQSEGGYKIAPLGVINGIIPEGTVAMRVDHQKGRILEFIEISK